MFTGVATKWSGQKLQCKSLFIGRTEFGLLEVYNEEIIDASVNEGYERIGDFMEVEVTSAEHYDLYARVL